LRSPQGRWQNLFLLLCFLSACHFFGPTYNPMFLLPAVLGPLLIIVTTPMAVWAQVAQERSVFFWSCLGGLALIVGHYLIFTISSDASFMPSILLACLPLWALSVSLLKNPSQLWLFLTLLVTFFVLVTSVEFLFDQQRAHAPLRDPGNYLTLVYLVGLPWLLFILRRDWGRWSTAMSAGLIFMFALAMLATQMRFGMLVVVGVLSFVLLATLFRYEVSRVSVVAASAAILLALAVYFVLDLPGLVSSFAKNTTPVSEANPRLLIWHSALQAVIEFGGINGSGLYTFSLLYPLFRSPLEQGTSGVLVHNDLLQFALEGGIWLALPLACLFTWVAFMLFRRIVVQRSLGLRSGMLLALAVAFVHSSLNFVFYVLPLVILVGVMLGLTLVPIHRASVAPGKAPMALRISKLAVVSLLVLNIFYLCLDVLSNAVFANNKLVPGASQIASDPAATRSYVQWAQKLNGRRALPAFVEARLLEQDLGSSPTPLLMTQTDLAYQAAVDKDPWNPAIRLSYVQFRNQYFTDAEARAAQESALYDVLNLNRANLNTNLMLYRWHQTYGSEKQQQEIAANIILWCELMSGHPGAEEIYHEIEGWAGSSQLAELAERAQRCQAWTQKGTGGGRKKTWFMRWMDSTRGIGS
jgi:O-antigen ligase